MQDGFGVSRGLGLGRIHVYAKNDLFIFLVRLKQKNLI